MRLEGHDRGGDVAQGGLLDDAPKYGLMPTMYPIEIADGDSAGALAVVARKMAVNSEGRFHIREFTILRWLTLEKPLVPNKFFCLPLRCACIRAG